MASKSTPRRAESIQRPRTGYIAPLPHPSWRLAPANASIASAATRLTSASDFWGAIGL